MGQSLVYWSSPDRNVFGTVVAGQARENLHKSDILPYLRTCEKYAGIFSNFRQIGHESPFTKTSKIRWNFWRECEIPLDTYTYHHIHYIHMDRLSGNSAKSCKDIIHILWSPRVWGGGTLFTKNLKIRWNYLDIETFLPIIVTFCDKIGHFWPFLWHYDYEE